MEDANGRLLPSSSAVAGGKRRCALRGERGRPGEGRAPSASRAAGERRPWGHKAFSAGGSGICATRSLFPTNLRKS